MLALTVHDFLLQQPEQMRPRGPGAVREPETPETKPLFPSPSHPAAHSLVPRPSIARFPVGVHGAGAAPTR